MLHIHIPSRYTPPEVESELGNVRHIPPPSSRAVGSRPPVPVGESRKRDKYGAHNPPPLELRPHPTHGILPRNAWHVCVGAHYHVEDGTVLSPSTRPESRPFGNSSQSLYGDIFAPVHDRGDSESYPEAVR